MRKILCGILTIIICSFGVISLAEDYDMQKEQENIKDKIDQSTNELENVKSELSENMQKIQSLDESMLTSQNEIDKLNSKIDEIQKNVDSVQEVLDVEEKKFNSQENTLKERLVAIYEAGETQYIDIILTSKNISEFLSNCYLASQIASNDMSLLKEMGDKKNEINIKKEELNEVLKEIGEVKQEQTKKSKILENSKRIKENYVAQLSQEEKEIQTKIDEYNQRFHEINSQILELAQQGLDTKYIGGVLAWPVPGYTRITSKYGMRTHPITGVYKLHTGVDVGAPMGASFIAANDGLVVKAGFNSAYGNMVIIDHGGGISTLYAHGSEIKVQEGEYVKRNQEILKVGSTGYSTGAHAHFEVRINGVVTDPMPYITNGLIPGTETTEQTNEQK